MPLTSRRDQLTDAISCEVRRSQNRTDAYDQAVSDALGINRTDHRCLDIIEQEGTITAGRLSELMGLTTGAMTAVLDRLERAGYVLRVRDEQDRRRIYVELQPKLHEHMRRYYEPPFEMSKKLYARYTDEQLELLLDFLETAAELSEHELTRLREQLAASAKSSDGGKLKPTPDEGSTDAEHPPS